MIILLLFLSNWNAKLFEYLLERRFNCLLHNNRVLLKIGSTNVCITLHYMCMKSSWVIETESTPQRQYQLGHHTDHSLMDCGQYNGLYVSKSHDIEQSGLVLVKLV